MQESKQNQANSKSQVNLQTRNELQAEESFLHCEDSLLQHFSGLGNIANASVQAQMLSRIPAGQIAANPQLMLQMQQQFGNRHVSKVVQMARENSGQTSQQPVIQAKLKIGAPQRSPQPQKHLEQHPANETPSASVGGGVIQGKGDLTGNRQVTSEEQHPNKTGLPDRLKIGIENLSGYSLDDVKVHYNSDKPTQLQAHAYAQDTDIHIAPRQEKHLPHEAWHVVQQKQGRVKPTMQMQGGVNINDDNGLEKEADVMGAKAIDLAFDSGTQPAKLQKKKSSLLNPTIWSQTAQLIPNKNDLYWQRLRAKAGLPFGVNHLVNFILNAANAQSVGQNVVNSVNAWNLANPVGNPARTIINLRAAIDMGLNPTLAAPGNYANDTAYNPILTQILENNPFIQTVMDGTLQSNVSGWRNAAPMAGAIPAPGVGADDRVLETIDLFNRLTNIPGGLPAVNVNPIRGPHAAMNQQGNLFLGWAAARGNILHEFGHHLENNLGPADFATVHNFLTARTQVPAGGIGAGAMAGMRDAGYFFEHHPGYQIDMPQINAGGLAGRSTPQTIPQQFRHTVTTPYYAAKQALSRVFHATPLRYLGLIGSGLTQQVGRLASLISRRREPRNWGAKGVENFFVHNANNQQLSYSTATHLYNTGWYTGTTEYLSTTVEFFNRPSHTRELVRVDPLRVALFLYLANRPQYLLVRNAFNAGFPAINGVDLNDLIHVAG